MAPARKAAEVYVATVSGSCEIDGETYVFVRGQTRIRDAGSGAAILKAVPDYFERAEHRLSYDSVEQATAGPGEERGD